MSRIESVRFANARGESLAGALHHPSAPATGWAVIVAHGMLSSKGSPKHRAVCERAATLGATALRFDFAGRGESEGDPELIVVSRQVGDLQAAVAEVRSRHAHRVALVGSSLGGTVALLTAAADQTIDLVATVASPARLPRAPRPAWGATRQSLAADRFEVEPGRWISNELFRDAARHDVLAAACGLARPWQIIHGARDEVVPVGDAHDFSAAAPHAKLLIHPEADHRFSAKAWRVWLIDRLAEWLECCE